MSKVRFVPISSWRHQKETFSVLLAFCAGNSPATGGLPSQGQCCGALIFSLICAWINGWANNRDLRRHRAHYDVIVMLYVLHKNVKTTMIIIAIVHYVDVTWVSLRRQSQPTRLFVQRVHEWHSPDKGPVARGAFLMHTNVIPPFSDVCSAGQVRLGLVFCY